MVATSAAIRRMGKWELSADSLGFINGGDSTSNGGGGSRSRSSSNGGGGSRSRCSSNGDGGSRSRSSSNGGTSNSDASYSYKSVSSLSNCSLPPELMGEVYWCGLDRSGRLCEHGITAKKKVCFGDKDTGRRFFGCPFEEDEEQCKYAEYRDPPYTKRMQRFIKYLWIMGQVAMKKAKEANDDLLATAEASKLAIQMRNEAVEKKDELLREKAEEMKKAEAALATSHFYSVRRLRHG